MYEVYAHGMNNHGLVYLRLINATVLQRRQKVFITSRAKLYSEHYVIKYVGDQHYCFLYCATSSKIHTRTLLITLTVCTLQYLVGLCMGG